MATVTPEILHDIVAAAVRTLAPQRIVLFGSHARGEAGPDADLDLLVIERGPFGQHKTRQGEIRRLRRALWNVRVPMDILVYSEEEVAAWRNSPNHIIARSLREGKTLYERY